MIQPSGAPLRCQCGIDAHAHVVPENFPRYLGAAVPAEWPSMAPAQECHRNVMIAGKNYRTVSDKCWDTGKRLQDLEAMGIELHAVSPMPELLSHWMQAGDAQQLLRFLNEEIARMVAASQERRPRLRIAFSHGGGTLGLLLPRLQQSWGVFPALKEGLTASPREQARKLFYDTLVFDAPTLAHLVALYGETQMIIGTDYPFNFHERDPIAAIEAAGFDKATRELLLRGNAQRFLGVTQ